MFFSTFLHYKYNLNLFFDGEGKSEDAQDNKFESIILTSFLLCKQIILRQIISPILLKSADALFSL